MEPCPTNTESPITNPPQKIIVICPEPGCGRKMYKNGWKYGRKNRQRYGCKCGRTTIKVPSAGGKS